MATGWPVVSWSTTPSIEPRGAWATGAVASRVAKRTPSLVIRNLPLFYTCLMGTRTLAAVIAVLSGIAGLIPVLGQEPPTLRVDVSLVTVDVEVTDAAGRPVNTLKREDFEVFENGTLQSLRSFDSVDAPYNIMLLFDCS